MEIPQEFDSMRSYEDSEVRGAILKLLDDERFRRTVLRRNLKGIPVWVLKWYTKRFKTVDSFQIGMIRPVIEKNLRTSCDGFSHNLEVLPKERQDFLFLSNHRDIVLDSTFLDYVLLSNNKSSVEIGIGNNLLIYPWIETIVRLNRSFIVNRSASAVELLEASNKLSAYIRFVITQKQKPVWLAQREGRAKDSNDRTQKGVLKMLTMSGEGSIRERLMALHITPLTISYEYDPCDWLKAEEFQLKRDNPDFKKSQQDDLDNMRTGIDGYKGRIHYEISQPIDQEIAQMDDSIPRNLFLDKVAELIDRHIFKGYRIYPCNRIALDMLRGDNAQSAFYTDKDKQKFLAYLDGQLKKITIPNPDWDFLKERILTMYANPLINHLSVMEQ